MPLTYQEFRDIILGDAEQISRADFKEQTNLVALWHDRMPEDDIRKTSFEHDLDAFLDFCYNYLIDGIDNIMGEFFSKRLECKEMPGFSFAPIDIKGQTIQNIPYATRYIRSVFAREMLYCTNAKGERYSIRNTFLRMYRDGYIVPATCLSPSLFVHYKLDDLSYVPDVMIAYIRNVGGMMSVFSPLIYRSILRRQQQLIKTDNGHILCPTASWGSPVIAAKTCDYEHMSIVDVQEGVLEKCHRVHDDISDKHPLFEEDEFTLDTFCVPSERMTEKVTGEFSHIFFCPPYYDLEMYDDQNGLQSTTLYKTYEEWLEGYWRGTLTEAKKLGKKGGVFSFVMNNTTKGYPIGTDMDRMAKEHFEPIEELRIVNIPKNNTSDTDERYEVVYTYRM